MMLEKRMSYSVLFSSLTLGLVFYCLFASQLTAQMSAISMSQILPPSATNDIAAQAEMQRVVEASGGMKLWQSMGSSILRYQAVDVQGGKQQPNSLKLDDWSSDKVRYRRGHAGMKVKPMDHNGHSSLQVYSPKDKKIFNIPELDQARVLADHLPAAAALVILRNPAYIVRLSSNCTSEKNCIAVYRKFTFDGSFQREQEWEINASTHLPEQIRLAMTDVLPYSYYNKIWKTVWLSDYRPAQGAQVPHRVSYGMQNLQGLSEQLVSARFSVGFNAEAFDKETEK